MLSEGWTGKRFYILQQHILETEENYGNKNFDDEFENSN